MENKIRTFKAETAAKLYEVVKLLGEIYEDSEKLDNEANGYNAFNEYLNIEAYPFNKDLLETIGDIREWADTINPND